MCSISRWSATGPRARIVVCWGALHWSSCDASKWQAQQRCRYLAVCDLARRAPVSRGLGVVMVAARMFATVHSRRGGCFACVP